MATYLARRAERSKWELTAQFKGCAWRKQGEWMVPDKQGRLDVGMLGQVFYCPNCGTEHPATVEGAFTCTKCTAHYTLSVGLKSNGDVNYVRIDRWR
jgi:hypothetical protein